MNDQDLLLTVRRAVLTLKQLHSKPKDRVWVERDLDSATALIRAEVVPTGSVYQDIRAPEFTKFRILWRLFQAIDEKRIQDAETARDDLESLLGPKGAAPRTPKRVRGPTIEARGAFLYERLVVRGEDEKKVRAEVNANLDWPRLSGRSHTYKMLDSHIEFHTLPQRPQRKTGRPPKTSTEPGNVNRKPVDKS